ncbi:amidohydrolase family protein [Agromyces mediolanus]|uniref:amidohydrolase family protein n=1 Tax=Agromyces mediolanus TaxID=41986 RepID=UPI0038367EC1
MASETTADLLVRGARLDRDAAGAGAPADAVVDVVVRDGAIAAIGPDAGAGISATEVIDADGGLVTTPFVEPHSHPDKVYSRQRIAELGLVAHGPRPVLMQRQRDLKAAFTVDDVAERAGRFLRASALEGIGLLAGQADIDSVTGLASVEGVLRARADCDGVIETVVTAFPQEGMVGDARAYGLVAEALAMGADRVGGWPNNEADEEASLTHLRLVFELAERFGRPIDINVDYFTDPSERLLEPLAELTIAYGMQGLVNANHVGALETYADDDAARVIEKVAEAGIAITVCPSNLQSSYPYRGVSRPNELLDAGVTVTIGTGNHEDNWESLGTLDPLERARFAWHALPLADRAGEGVDDAWRMVTSSARRAVGRPAPRLEAGAEASFVVLAAGDRLHALRNEAGSRWTVRRGALVASRRVSRELVYS